MNYYSKIRGEKTRYWMRSFVMGYFVFGVVGCYANTNDELRAYQAEGVKQAALTSSTQIENLEAASVQTQTEHKTLIDTLMQSTLIGLQARQKPQGAEGAVLFASFSMPDGLLFALADEAARFNIPVVINGLVDGDFKKTIETFKRLNVEAKKQHLNFKGVSIDPVWFTQFNIKSVPALVVIASQKSCEPDGVCSSQFFDVVYGNVNLKNSLELIAEKGEVAASRAKTILEKGHV